MEDAHSIVKNFAGNQGDIYLGLFDGDGGNGTAMWCFQKFHQLLESNVQSHGSMLQMSALMATTFQQADDIICNKFQDYDDSGCTAAVGYIKCANESCSQELLSPFLGNATSASIRNKKIASYLYTANVGDARIVICHRGKAERLTTDHRIEDTREIQRVIKAGGQIIGGRVDGVLAVTRSLGDAKFKDYVCGKPYTTETLLDDVHDEFFIIACDGLWDVCSDQNAVDLIRHVYDCELASRCLVQHALKCGATDNISCIVVRLVEPSKFKAMVSGIRIPRSWRGVKFKDQLKEEEEDCETEVTSGNSLGNWEMYSNPSPFMAL
jgi:protein phosphatase PTC1